MKSFARLLATFCALSAPALWAQSVGAITTVAGNGTAGYTGDGGLATGAELSQAFTAAAGIITTISGRGTGLPADGVPAASVSQISATDVATDSSGNVFAALGGLLVKIYTGGNLHFLTALASGFTNSCDGII